MKGQLRSKKKQRREKDKKEKGEGRKTNDCEKDGVGVKGRIIDPRADFRASRNAIRRTRHDSLSEGAFVLCPR